MPGTYPQTKMADKGTGFIPSKSTGFVPSNNAQKISNTGADMASSCTFSDSNLKSKSQGVDRAVTRSQKKMGEQLFNFLMIDFGRVFFFCLIYITMSVSYTHLTLPTKA